MNFPIRLKELRGERGWTQDVLGSKLNYRGTTISNYEQGTNKPAHYDLIALAKIFDVTTDYLLCITDNRFSAEFLHEDTYISDVLECMEQLEEENKAKILEYTQKILNKQSGDYDGSYKGSASIINLNVSQNAPYFDNNDNDDDY